MTIKNILFFICFCLSSFFIQTSFGASEAPTPERHGVKLEDVEKLDAEYDAASGFKRGTFNIPRPSRPSQKGKINKPIPEGFSRDESDIELEEEEERGSASGAGGYSSGKAASSTGYSSYGESKTIGSMSRPSGPIFDQDTMTFHLEGNDIFPGPTTSSIPEEPESAEALEGRSLETIDINSPNIILYQIDFTIKALKGLVDKDDLIDHLNSIVVGINKLHAFGYLNPLHVNENQRRLSSSINATFPIYGLGYEQCNALQLVIIYLQSPNAVRLLLRAGADVNNKFATLPGENENISFYTKTLDLVLFVENKEKAKQIARLLAAKGAQCSEGYEYAIQNLLREQNVESPKKSRIKSFLEKMRKKSGE